MSRPSQSARSTRAASLLLPVAAAAGVLIAGGAAVALLGEARAVALAAVLALLAVAVAGAAATALALVVRRRLGELRHLPDLGRRYVTHLDHGTVTQLSEGPGELTVHLSCTSGQTIVLDESGAPDHVTSGAPDLTRWRLSTARLRPEQLARLRAMLAPGTDASVVASGVVQLAGPVQREWRLTTPDGLSVSARGSGA